MQHGVQTAATGASYLGLGALALQAWQLVLTVAPYSTPLPAAAHSLLMGTAAATPVPLAIDVAQVSYLVDYTHVAAACCAVLSALKCLGGKAP